MRGAAGGAGRRAGAGPAAALHDQPGQRLLGALLPGAGRRRAGGLRAGRCWSTWTPPRRRAGASGARWLLRGAGVAAPGRRRRGARGAGREPALRDAGAHDRSRTWPRAARAARGRAGARVSSAGENAARAAALAPGESADVGLLLEGTYPYVSGGVSSWVHEIITGLPELTFGAIFLGASPETYGEIRYRLPPQPGAPRDPLLDVGAAAPAAGGGAAGPNGRVGAGRAGPWRRWCVCTTPFARAAPRSTPSGSTPRGTLGDAKRGLARRLPVQRRDLGAAVRRVRRALRVELVPRLLLDRAHHAPAAVHAGGAGAARAPVPRAARGVDRLRRLPGRAACSASAAARSSSPSTASTPRSARSTSRSAAWIKDEARDARRRRPRAGVGYLRQLWIRFFEGLGRAGLRDRATRSSRSTRATAQRQIEDGAAPERTRVIPNGIDVARFAALRASAPPAQPPPVLGLVGRVVPIKDIKTFIRAMRTVVAGDPRARRAGSSAPTTRIRATPRSAARWRAAWGSRSACGSSASDPPKRCCRSWA